MIFEFLLPIIGWLILFGILYVIYSQIFYKNMPPQHPVEGQSLYTAITGFFWVVVYFCLSSIWSILYSLIDLKYPDVVGSVSNYGVGMQSVGVIYDTFAFPLAMVVVSSITALILAFWLIAKFQKNKNLRPEKLYLFMKTLVFIGGAVMIFSGFVYVVYSWFYGNLPMAVFLKGVVAVIIVGMVALYFYLTTESKNTNDSLIGRMFAVALVAITLATISATFSVIGTPAQARLYRIDSITLQNLQTVKNEIDSQDQNFAKKVQNLSEIGNEYVKIVIKKTDLKYSTNDTNYTLCANFNTNMPETVNMENRDTTWDYKAGESCFTFKHLPPYPNVVTQQKTPFK